MRETRVVVTGIGAVTPLGCGREAFARRLFAGETGVRPLAHFDPGSSPARLAAEVEGFSPQDFIRPATLRRMDRLSRMATAAARMALDDAGLGVGPHNRDRVGIVFGTAFGSTDVAAQFAGVIFTDSPRRANPILVPNTVMNAPAGHAAIELGVRGVNTTLNHREVSAETAIAVGAGEILRGRADAVLAGGGDILSEFFMTVLGRFRMLSPTDGGEEAIRPFDAERNGTVAGEGVGVLCLERLETAEARGALPYCEIAGWGFSSAPAPPTDWPTDARGPRLAIDRALASAGVTPQDVDLVAAAANGGLRLDRLEADVLAAAFAGSPGRPRVTALKGALGEGFASGGIRSAATALALRSRTLPPTCGLSRPMAPLNFVRQPETVSGIRCALVNGMASGGTFAALVLKALSR